MFDVERRPIATLSREFTVDEHSIASELPNTTYHVPPMVTVQASLTSIMPVS